MGRKDNLRKADMERLKALDDARIAMLKRHEKPIVIRAVTEAFEKLYAEVYRK